MTENQPKSDNLPDGTQFNVAGGTTRRRPTAPTTPSSHESSGGSEYEVPPGYTEFTHDGVPDNYRVFVQDGHDINKVLARPKKYSKLKFDSGGHIYFLLDDDDPDTIECEGTTAHYQVTYGKKMVIDIKGPVSDTITTTVPKDSSQIPDFNSIFRR